MKIFAAFAILFFAIWDKALCQSLINERHAGPQAALSVVQPPQPPTVTKKRVSVRVLDKNTLKPVISTLIVTGQKPGKQIIPTFENGVYKFKIPVNDTSIISIFADGYELLIESITANKMGAREVFYLTPKSEAASAANAMLVSNRTPTGSRRILTEEVRSVLHFKRSRAIILTASKPELDRLVEHLAENPEISIRLAGHTDSEGDAGKNMSLSNERVKVVKQYLVDHHIAAGRISGKGFGSNVPAAPNDCEENRRRNRRVEIIVTEE
ncbi:OmpA family protein [Dyadobacter pollutisoli]|uniref:OmpA family protein n=1 Tax=Dyadobacter pollutisoli TaxID=2910158 RepID=A0A9E8SMA5_9BACT|nr:OmpA family protein [Dyadobacter pollutisoli]WAC12571.1 OmpA family protein [Dyadobacter pollutisoli]